MKNKIMSGHTLTVTRVALSEAGKPYDLGGGLVGIACADYAANVPGEYEVSGVKTFPNDAIRTIGSKVDWDVAGGKLAAAAVGDFSLGTVVKPATAAEECLVMVNTLPGPGPSYT